MSDDNDILDVEEDEENVIEVESRPVGESDIVVKMDDGVASEEIVGMLSTIINMGDSQILHEPSCKICNSACRDQVEEVWSQSESMKVSERYAEIQKLYKESTGKTISRGAIKNHVLFHHDKEIREIQK